jgi:hypothetical protein
MCKSHRAAAILSILFFGSLAVFPACAPRPFDRATEEGKLLRIDAEWADLATAGKDVDKIVSYWSDDAILMFPGQPLIKGGRPWIQNPLEIRNTDVLARRQAGVYARVRMK